MPIARSRLETLQICKLLQCVNEKDYDQIKKLVKSGIQYLINYSEPQNGETALSTAAVANDDQMIKFLVELGAHPDMVDFEGRTPAMRAAEYGHVQCLEVLAEKGANFIITDNKGKNVLFYCICPTERHTQCMDIALQHKADVNNRAKDGRTAFFSSCESAKENEAACLSLIDKGADVEQSQLTTGRTPLMAACSTGSVSVVRAILRKGAEVNTTDKYGKTAAHDAAKRGHFEVLLVLGGNGAVFDVYDNKGNNPIHLACSSNALCVKYLGQRGCNPKAKNTEGDLPKNIAKDSSVKDVSKELRKVEKSFGKIGKDNEPTSIAMYDWVLDHEDELAESIKTVDADESGFVQAEEMLEILKNLGAPLNEEIIKKIVYTHDKNKDGKFDTKEFLTGKKYVNKNYLLSSFAGKKKKSKKGKGGKGKKKGKCPMDICIMPSSELLRTLDGGPPIMYIPKHENITDTERFDCDRPPKHPIADDSVWYVNHPNKTFISLNDAAKHGDLDSIKHALLNGYKIDTRDRYYKTPLMIACHYGNLDVAKALIELGANVNLKDNFHWTPLHHAAHAGMIDVVELLITNGAMIDAVAMNGATPLFRAIESSRLNVVEYLIKHGAKVNVENRKGANPMDASYFWADPRVLVAVKNKFDTLPATSDKKKGAKGGGRAKSAPGSGKSKGAPRASSAAQIAEPVELPSNVGLAQNFQAERKASILRAASALARGEDEEEDNIKFTPRQPWIPQATSKQCISQKQQHRDRMGWESDFPETFDMPFAANVRQRCILLGGAED